MQAVLGAKVVHDPLRRHKPDQRYNRAVRGLAGPTTGFLLTPRIRVSAPHTLYKALQRLEDAGLLASRWEDPDIAAAEGRPRRRLYQVTGVGERALAAWRVRRGAARPRPRLEPT